MTTTALRSGELSPSPPAPEELPARTKEERRKRRGEARDIQSQSELF